MGKQKTIGLLQQALAKEKELKLKRYAKGKRATNALEALKVLLPGYEPTPKQAKYHNSNAKEKGIKGGYQSGKTTAFAAEGIALAYMNRPHPVLLVSPSSDLAEDVVGKKLEELCEANGLEYEYLTSKGLFTIILSNNKKENLTIYLAGSDKPKFLKGYSVAAVGMDEPFIQSKEALEVVLSRKSIKCKRNIFFWSGTPEPEYMEWGLEYFEKDEDTPDLFTITLPTYENVHLSKEYVNDLEKKYDTKTQEVFLKGKYRVLSANPAYHAFERKRNTLPDVLIPKEFNEMLIGFDFNVDPMSAAIYYFTNMKYYQVKEFSVNNSNTKELCGAIIAYITDKKIVVSKSIIISGDATGKRRGTRSTMSDYEIIRDEFTKAGLPFYFVLPNENPAVRDRVNYVNKLFETEQLIIAESCVKTIADRELVTWKASSTGFALDKSKKDRTHLSDAADYPLYNTQVLLDTGTDEGGGCFACRESR